MLIKILLLLFVAVAIWRVWQNYFRQHLAARPAVCWTILWLAAALAIIDPWLTTALANYLGVGRGTDLAFYASAVVIFYLLFRLFIKMDEQKKQITILARKQALLATQLNPAPDSKEESR
jgi:hypothetical protein